MNALSLLSPQEIAERIGWTLLHSVWQTALIGIVLALLLRWLRGASANLRYALACSALALVVLWPIRTSGILSVPAHRTSVRTEPAPRQAPVATAPTRQESAVRSSAPTVAVRPARVHGGSWKDGVVSLARPALPYLTILWLTGVIVLSLWHVGEWGRLQFLRRRCARPPEKPLRDRLASLARTMQIRRPVQIVESTLVQVPSVIGWLRPMILLPASALTALPPAHLEALLAHELAHIRRQDYLVNVLQTVVEILGFYHPAVWWISRQIRIERENGCDDLAAETVGDRLRYARALASMEDLRAGRPEWVLAASGGSLLARIRRLVGRTPAENRSSPWAPAIVVATLLVSLAVPIGLVAAGYHANPATELERKVLKGFAENRARVTCGVLAWTQTTEDNGFGRPVPQGGLKYDGQYRMWWDGDRVATKYNTEGVHSSRETPPSGIEVGWHGADGRSYWIGQTEGGNVYTGSLLTREPQWSLYENWLSGVIRWRGRGSQDRRIIDLGRMKHVAAEWSVAEVEGRAMIRCLARNRDTGEYSVEHYDPAKGYGLAHYEAFTPQGVRRSNHTVKLEQVIPGAWFPVEVVMEAIRTEDGSVSLRQHMTLDLTHCSFNDKSALPAGIFEARPRREQDEMRRILEETQRRRTGRYAVDAVVRTQGPRAASEGFLAATAKADYEQAAAFVHPRQPVDDLKEFGELLKGQDLRLAAVLADDEVALTVTSAIRADHGKAGPLVFHLARSSAARAGWLIDDIDVESPQGAGREIESFLQGHPAAAMTLDGGGNSTRVVRFSADCSVGMLYVREWDFPTDSYEAGMNWQWLGEAQGDVTVPAGKALRLDLSPDAWQTGSPLATLRPDDVQMLDLSKCKSANDAVLADVAKLEGLRALGLTATAITGEGLGDLKDLKGLKWLFLGSTHLGDEGAAHLADFGSLEYLNLRYTKITDAAMVHVGRLRGLKSLSLDGTAVSDKGLAHLKNLISLHDLSLWDCAITSTGFEHLAGLTEMRTLDLVSTQIADDGLVHLAGMKNLRRLRLGFTKVTGEGLVHLRGLQSLEYLELPDADIGDEHLAYLNGLDHLKELHGLGDLITEKGLRSLARLKSLEELDTGGQAVTDEAAAVLATFPALKSLQIQKAGAMTDAGLAQLVKLKSLTKLSLMRANVTGAGLALLKGLPSLKELTLDNLYIAEGEFSALGDLSTLERLDIGMDLGWSNIAFGDRDMTNLAKLKDLRSLRIVSKRVSDAGLQHLSGLQSLQSLMLSGPGITDAGVAHLEGLRSLRYLSLTETGVTREGVERLQRIIPGLECYRQ